MSEIIPTMKDFEEMLFSEWSNPNSNVLDPVIIIEEQNLARRVAGALACHVTVVSNRWPESTTEERTEAVLHVLERMASRDSKRCTRWTGLTKDEADQLGWNITFAHPDFDIDKPHDSVEDAFGVFTARN